MYNINNNDVIIIFDVGELVKLINILFWGDGTIFIPNGYHHVELRIKCIVYIFNIIQNEPPLFPVSL